MRITLHGVGIGEEIKKARRAKSMTQPVLSEACGWGYVQARISHYERGRREPSIDDLRMLAKTLDVSVGQLFGERTQAPRPPRNRVIKSAEKLISLPVSRQKLIQQLIDELIT